MKQSSTKNMESWVEAKYMKLKTKYVLSMYGFVTLNILSFAIAAAIIILNLFAIRFNDVDSTKPLFISISALGGFVSFITTLISFFTLKKAAAVSKTKMERIEIESNKHTKKVDEYADKNRDHILVKKITDIYNEIV